MKKKTTQLRQLLKQDGPVVLCGVHDGLTARLAERAGFDSIWASGYCISTSKGLPDVGVVTMSEHLAVTREINRATGLPVVADVDDGFGDVLNVVRMVREYEAAGIAAVCIEDNRHPKRNSLYGELAHRLVSTEEFVAKVRAAKETQTDPDFVVIARVEALVADMGLDEAFHRAHAYADAGADLVLMHSKDRNPDKIKEFGAKWNRDVPLVAVPTKYPQLTTTELFASGYRMIIFANQGLRASIAAMERVFHRMIEEQSTAGVEDEITPLSEIYSLAGFDEAVRIESKFAVRPTHETSGTKDKS